MIKPTEGKDQKEFDPKKFLYNDPCHRKFNHLDTATLIRFLVYQTPSTRMFRFIRYAMFLMDKSGGDLNRWQFHSLKTIRELLGLQRQNHLAIEEEWIQQGWISKIDQKRPSGASAPSLRRLGHRFNPMRRCDHFDTILQMYAALDAANPPETSGIESMPPVKEGRHRIHASERHKIDAPEGHKFDASERHRFDASNLMISNPMNFKGVRTSTTASAASGAGTRVSGGGSKSAGTDQNATISPGVEAMLREAELLGLALNASMLQATVDYCQHSLSAPIPLIREQWPLCVIHISQVNSPDPYQVFRNWMDREIKRRKQADRNRSRSNRRSARNGVDLHERIASSSEPVNQVDQLKLIDEL
jgi:hypothetical protein